MGKGKRIKMEVWITAIEMNPTEWGRKQSFFRADATLEGRYKVRLEDGREIYSTWENGYWSVERLKPALKVASWRRPIIRA